MSQSQESEKTEPKPAAKESKEEPEIQVYNPEAKSLSVLLVAPHAFEPKKDNEKRDDYFTKEITEEIAARLDCKALINKDWKKKSPEKHIYRIRNYNDEPQATNDKKFKRELRAAAKNEGPLFVLWVHGATNTNIDEEKDFYNTANPDNQINELHAVLGYGQRTNDETVLTASKDTADEFIGILQDKGLITVAATTFNKKKSKTLCANQDANMCQWLRKQGYPINRVQSIQIEIRRSLRQPDKYPGTADKLALALSELTGIEIQDPIAQNKAIAVASNEKDPVDESLVEEAYSELRNILVNHLRKGMLEAGKYLIEKFYDNDVELARQKSSPKKASLNKLKKKLQNSDGNAPSKTWIYDAVNLAVDHHDYANDSVYGKLGHSHQVNLTYVKDPDKKKTLIKETAKNEYTVAKLKKEIAKAKGKKEPVTLGMLRDVEALKKRDLPELQEMDDVTVEIIKNLKSKLTGYEEALKGLKEVIAEKAAQDNEGLEN